MKKAILLLIMSTLVIGCNVDKTRLVGFWVVSELKIKGSDTLISADYNGLSFNKNGTCVTPEINWTENNKGTWEILKQDTDKILIIKSDNFINGKYHYRFYTDPLQRQYKMQIISESLDITCVKLTRYNN